MVGESSKRDAHLLVLRAVGAHAELARVLVLKGAYATEAITGVSRSTLDIDLTGRSEFCSFDRAGERRLKQLFYDAIDDFCEEQAPEWSIYTVSAKRQPRKGQKFGWDAFEAKVTLLHRGKEQHVVELDVSFGDFFGEDEALYCEHGKLRLAAAAEEIHFIGYSAEQIVAEKLRAFLQKLPRHREKLGNDRALPRVRDIHDIAAIRSHAQKEISLEKTALAFRSKCEARSVDCEGIEDFIPEPDSEETYRKLYEDDESLNGIPFEKAWESMCALLRDLFAEFDPPGVFPLPALAERNGTCQRL